MAVQVRGVSTGTPTNATSFAVAPPAGVQAGDLMLMEALIGSAGQGFQRIPAGWAIWPGGMGQGVSPCLVLYRIATGSEPANYTFYVSSSVSIAASIIALYSDAALGLKIEDFQGAYNGVTDFIFPSVNFVSSAGIMVCLAAGNASSATPTAGFTERFDIATSPRQYCQTKVISASGATGSATTTGTDQDNNAFSLAIAEGAFVVPTGPSFREWSRALAAVVTSQTFAAPADLQVGDLMVALVGFGTTDATPAISGWTIPTNGNLGGIANGTYLFTKRAVAGDIGATFSVSWGGASRTVVIYCVAFFSPGAHTVILDVVASSAHDAQNITIPTVTATAINELWLMLASSENAGTSTLAATALTARLIDTSNTAPRVNLVLRQLAAAGATGTYTITRAGSVGSNHNRAFSVLLRDVLTPADPSALSAVATGATSITASWTDNSSEDGFELDHSTDGATWSLLTSPATNVTSFNHSGLTEFTLHYYRVRAVTAGIYSNYSSSANATTDILAPTGLTATAASDTVINLAWTNPSGVSPTFKVEQSSNGTTGWSVIQTTAPNATSFSVTGLSNNTTRYYRVRASSGADFSAYTSVASATTLPAAATSLTAVSSVYNQVNLSWIETATGETGWKIERSPDNSTWAQIGTAAANSTSYADNTVAQLTTYFYRVRSYTTSPAQNSAYSNVATVITPSAFIAPSGLTANALGQHRIQISWTGLNADETGTEIYRALTGAGAWVLIATVAAGIVTYIDTGLASNTEYFYKVRDKKVS